MMAANMKKYGLRKPRDSVFEREKELTRQHTELLGRRTFVDNLYVIKGNQFKQVQRPGGKKSEKVDDPSEEKKSVFDMVNVQNQNVSFFDKNNSLDTLQRSNNQQSRNNQLNEMSNPYFSSSNKMSTDHGKTLSHRKLNQPLNYSTEPSSHFVTYAGSDMYQQGRNSLQYFANQSNPNNTGILNLSGTPILNYQTLRTTPMPEDTPDR